MDKFTFTGSQEHTTTIEAPATIFHAGNSNVMVILLLDGHEFTVANLPANSSFDVTISGEYKLVTPSTCADCTSYVVSELPLSSASVVCLKAADDPLAETFYGWASGCVRCGDEQVDVSLFDAEGTLLPAGEFKITKCC